MRQALYRLVAAIAGAFILSPAAQAGDIRVLTSNGMAELMGQLVPAFERASGHHVVADFGPSQGIATRVRSGEPFDVVIIIRQSAMALQSEGKITAGSMIDIARTRMAIAVRAGAPKPDISDADALKRSLLGAKSIAHTEIGGSGIHFIGVLERLGILQEIKPRLKSVAGTARAADLVVSGEAEFAVQMTSELVPVSGVEVVGPFPAPFSYEVVLAGGVSASSRDADAATALLNFLASPAAAPLLSRSGLEPM